MTSEDDFQTDTPHAIGFMYRMTDGTYETLHIERYDDRRQVIVTVAPRSIPGGEMVGAIYERPMARGVDAAGQAEFASRAFTRAVTEFAAAGWLLDEVVNLKQERAPEPWGAPDPLTTAPTF